MGRLRLRRHVPLRGANGRRMIIVLMVVAAGVLLALPATAGAHVDKKYRAEYTRTLDSYSRLFYRWETLYVNLEVMLTANANSIRPLIGSADPNDQAELAALEHRAKITHDNQELVMKGWAKTLKASFNGFRAKGLRWFDSRSERARFVHQANLMQTYCGMLLTDSAFPRLSQAALMLSNGAVDLATQKMLEARDWSETAERDFEEALAALRKMR